jgi:hypothetical protein
MRVTRCASLFIDRIRRSLGVDSLGLVIDTFVRP